MSCDLHLPNQTLHFRIVLLLDTVVIVKVLFSTYMIAELESVTVESVVLLASSNVRDESLQINGRLGECASFAGNAWSMFGSIAGVFVIIDRGLNMPWLEA